MKQNIYVTILFIIAILSGCSDTETDSDMTISSVAVADGELLEDYQCDFTEIENGKIEHSIPLTWENVPDSAGSLSIVMYHRSITADEDVTNAYLILWGIDPSTTEIPYKGAGDGSWYMGANKDGMISYISPCSPSQGSHDYHIELYALSETPSSLPTEDSASIGYDEIVDAIQTVTVISSTTLDFVSITDESTI